MEIEDKYYVWDDIQQCADKLNSENYGGFDSWRVPTIEELRTIMTEESFENEKSYSKETYIKKPLLESMNMEYQWFWSSSEYGGDSTLAWFLYFYFGHDSYGYKSLELYVRCVVGRQ